MTIDIETINTTIVTLEVDISGIKAQISLIDGEIANLEGRADLTDSEILILKTDLAILRSDYQATVDGLQGEITALEIAINDLDDKIDAAVLSLKSTLDVLNDTVDVNTDSISDLLVSTTNMIADILALNIIVDDHETRLTSVELDVIELGVQIAAVILRIETIESQLLVLEGAISDYHTNLGLCFTFTNTNQVDLTNNDWFDNCVAASGNSVRIVVKSSTGAVLYDASGAKTSTWTQNHITSTTQPNSQYHSGQHGDKIPLDNGDYLLIPGKNSANAGCGGSFGNGYALLVYPSIPNYYTNVKLIVLSHNQFNTYIGPRYFDGWTQSHEISFNVATMKSCSFASNSNSVANSAILDGTVEFYVF